MSSTTAANMTNPQLVRSGSLTVEAGSYSDTGAGPNPYGPLIGFSSPYEYLGGDIVFLITHSAVTSGTGLFLDATSTNYGITHAQRTASSYNATTVAGTNAIPIMEISYIIPEPGTLALVGLGGMGLLGLRRRRK